MQILFHAGERVTVQVHSLRDDVHGVIVSYDGDGYYTILSDDNETWALCHEDMISLEPRA
jgi:hypothetical protein